MSEAPTYVVMRVADGPLTKWELVPATRRLFTAEGAAKYAAGLGAGRHPRIVTAAEYLLNWGGWSHD